LHDSLRIRIKRGRGFIENQNLKMHRKGEYNVFRVDTLLQTMQPIVCSFTCLGVAKNCSRDGDSLFLPTRKLNATLSKLQTWGVGDVGAISFELIWQSVDESDGICSAGRIDNLQRKMSTQ
jgi:hypothetical protein